MREVSSLSTRASSIASKQDPQSPPPARTPREREWRAYPHLSPCCASFEIADDPPNCGSRLRKNMQQMWRPMLWWGTRAGVAQFIGLCAGNALRSGLNASVASGATNTTGICVGAGVLVFGAAAGADFGNLLTRRILGERRATKGRRICGMILGAAISGGLPFASAWVAARNSPRTGPGQASEYAEKFVMTLNTAAGRMVAQPGRDLIGVIGFGALIGSVAVHDEWVEAIDLAQMKRFDLYRLSVGTVFYGVTSTLHLMLLRGHLTELFGFEEGKEWLAYFLSNFGNICSSDVNEIFDDVQMALIQAILAAILKYKLLYESNKSRCKCAKTPQEFTKSFALAVHHGLARVATYAPAEFLATWAMTFEEGSIEQQVALGFAGFCVGMMHWRGDCVRKGLGGSVQEPEQPQLWQPSPPAGPDAIGFDNAGPEWQHPKLEGDQVENYVDIVPGDVHGMLAGMMKDAPSPVASPRTAGRELRDPPQAWESALQADVESIDLGRRDSESDAKLEANQVREFLESQAKVERVLPWPPLSPGQPWQGLGGGGGWRDDNMTCYMHV